MNMTSFYIGAGIAIVGVAGYITYRYLKSIDKLPPKEIETIDEVNYEMLIKWLRDQYRQGIAKAGFQFLIMQQPVAEKIFKEAFPNRRTVIANSHILAIAIANKEEEVVAYRFILFNSMADSLKDLLPNNPNKVYVQNLE